MAMDIDKEFLGERKPDIGFLKPKRTKKRDEIQSPFGNYRSIVPSKKTEIENKVPSDHKDEFVAKTSSEIKSKPRPRAPKPVIKTERELSIIKKHGHIKCLYYLLLEKNCTDDLISRSHSDLAEILAIDKSSVRKVLADLINRKLLTKVKDSDPRTKHPATYKLTKIT